MKKIIGEKDIQGYVVLMITIGAFFFASCDIFTPEERMKNPLLKERQWSLERANDWVAQVGWPAGCNYNPSNSVNQLEMWQADTFSPEVIDSELELAESIGFNVIRVYLHDLAWETDKAGFISRMGQFLEIANSHGIKTLFVIFDDCWNENPSPGKQPDPIPGVHNSRWVQSPGSQKATNPEYWPQLEAYAKDVLTTFKEDERIFGWDLYNEPGQLLDFTRSFPLLVEVFIWAREVNPSQPLTAGVFERGAAWAMKMNQFQIGYSDIVSFHNYEKKESMMEDIEYFLSFGRPVICTEYMARGSGSTFEDIMPLLKANNIGAINWGFVDGKTQTKYSWLTWLFPGGTEEPEPWFHEILRADHTPYQQAEVELIKNLTGANSN